MNETARSSCPVACTLDIVGDRWTLLVLRDLLIGKQHYEEFLASPEGIATNVLAERLRRLVALNMVESQICSDNRRRKKYQLTSLGRSFAPVLAAIAQWGLAHLAGTQPWPEAQAALEQELKRQRKR